MKLLSVNSTKISVKFFFLLRPQGRRRPPFSFDSTVQNSKRPSNQPPQNTPEQTSRGNSLSPLRTPLLPSPPCNNFLPLSPPILSFSSTKSDTAGREMGTLVGHVAPGFGFFVIGFWHLFNHIKLHAIHHNYRALPWFPTSFLRYLELYLIMMGCSISVAMELFIGPDRHQPFDPDGTIPSNHLHNFEHSSISLTFFVYAVSAIVLDKSRPKSHHDVLQFIGAVAFAQQLLLFHLHSADHMGVEGHYHWLLQLVIFVSLSTTLLGIALPNSFMVSYVRSLSILFQGVWLMTMGFMLWTPELIPKGCFMHSEEGHEVVRCEGEKSLARAKSLVNIEFSWFLILLAIFSVSFYSVIVKIYGDSSAEYFKVMSKEEEEAEEEEADVEAQKRSKLSEKQSFIHVGKATTGIDHMER